jgi:hypothetical protein
VTPAGAVTQQAAPAPSRARPASSVDDSLTSNAVPFAIGAVLGLAALVLAGVWARRDLQRSS